MQIVEEELKEKVKQFFDSIGIRYEENETKLKIKGVVESMSIGMIPHVSLRIDPFVRLVIEKYSEKIRILYETTLENEHIRDLLINNKQYPQIQYSYGELILNF